MNEDDAKVVVERIRVSKKQGQIITNDEVTNQIEMLVLEYFSKFVVDKSFSKRFTDFIHLFYDMHDSLSAVLYKICDSDKHNENIKFYAFYSLYTLMRRNQNYNTMGQLINKYKNLYSQEPRLDIVLANYFIFSSENYVRPNFEKAIYHIERACKHPELINMIGVKALYAEIISIVIMNKTQEKNYQLTLADKERIMRAEELIEKEISDSEDKPYGKYFFIRAKLNMVNKKNQEALHDISSAVEYEAKRGYEAHLRIPEYIGLRIEIKQMIKSELHEEKIERLMKKSQKLADDLNENRTKIIEYITFFSGIIAFIVSTVQISLRVNTFSAFVGLIFVMSSMLIFSFTSFMLITHGFERKGITFLIILIPVLGLLALGIAIGFGWSVFSTGVQ